jgi:tetratricopeptide (TPR) repeat protein
MAKELQPEKLQQFGTQLETQAASSRLIDCLFAKDGTAGSPGRYAFLAPVILKNEPLRQALTANDPASIRRQWVLSLGAETVGKDLSFLHGLAILYRERALADLAAGRLDESTWAFSTVLWMMLLSSQKFWDYFAAHRGPNRAAQKREPLPEDQQDHLFQSTVQQILGLHTQLASRSFAEGKREHARVHLNCLNLCSMRQDKMLETLKKYSLTYSIRVNRERLEQVAQVASKMLDDWGVTLVREAENLLNDPDAIQRLPEGIEKNYEGAIAHLQKFIDLQVPVPRVLRTCLDWYNQYCYNLVSKQNIEAIKKLMQPARRVADLLVPHATQSLAHHPENAILSRHFLLRGFTNDDPAKSVEEYKEALAWNLANQDAQSLLGRATTEVLKQPLKTAMECADKGEYQKAHEVLNSIEAQVKNNRDPEMAEAIADLKEELKTVRAIIFFRNAQSLAEEGSFILALARGKDAAKLAPQEEVIQSFIKEMEKLAPEEDNLRHLHRGREFLDDDNFDQAIQYCNKVTRQSSFYGQARQMLSGAYFQRGIASANQRNFENAVADLAKSLEMNDKPDERKIISQQLALVKQAVDGHWIADGQAALDAEDFNEAIHQASQVPTSSSHYHNAQALLSVSYFKRGIAAANQRNFTQAEEDLEKALELNSNNQERKIISEQLEQMRAVARTHTLSAALEAGRWREVQNLVAEAQKMGGPNDLKKQLRASYANLLNQHAVEMINTMQKDQEKYVTALKAIMDRVRYIQSNSYVSDDYSYGSDCPVCGNKGAIHKVAREILDVVQRLGTFSIGSLELFWSDLMYGSHLCWSCKSTMKNFAEVRSKAVEFLGYAVKLDASNTTAKQNLAAISKM